MALSKKEKQRLRASYGPWAVVSGASSGIGKELAERLAESGLNLIIAARRREVLEELASEWESRYGVKVAFVSADVSTKEGTEKVIAFSQPYEVGLLVASAGFGSSGNFLDTHVETEVNMVDVNISSVLRMSRYFGEYFARRRKGGMILMSSLVAFQGVPYSTNYAATKAYIQSLAEGLRVELAPYNVDVLAAAPGPVNSGFASRADMQMNGALSVDQVGEPILKALGRKGTVFPGFLTKFLTASLAMVPRWAKVRVMKLVMGGMTAHQRVEDDSSKVLAKG